MPRLVALLTGLFLALLLIPSSASAASCSVKGLKPAALGPTYTTRLVVTKTSCATGKKFVKSYFNCRKAAGGLKAKCRKKVSGYTCTEKRDNVISYSFDATVTCKKGSRKIVHDYQQLL